VNTFRQTQLDPNIAAIESATGQPVVSMVWACGNTDPGRMAAAQSYFVGSRGYYDQYSDENLFASNLTWLYDINTPTPATVMNLNSDTFFSQTLVDRAINENGWEIVTVHDYCAGIDVLTNISPTVWIAPIGEVSKYIKVRNATQITDYASAGQQISFNAVHTLTTFLRYQQNGDQLLPIVYDNPVTLRVPIATHVDLQDVQANGVGISATVGTVSGTQYVWFSLPLTSTQHVVVTTYTPTAVKLSNLSAVPRTPDGAAALIAIGGAAVGAAVLWKRQQRHKRLSRG
jgi:hypothetical protein